MMKYIKFLPVLFLAFMASCSAPQKPVESIGPLKDAFTSDSARTSFKKNLTENIIGKNLNLPLNDSTEKNWDQAFWGMELILDSSRSAETHIKNSFKYFSAGSLSFQRSMMEAAYTLFPSDLSGEISSVVVNTSDPKIFAMGVNYLTNFKSSGSGLYLSLMNKKFPGWQQNPILLCLGTYLTKPLNKMVTERPPLDDLLSCNFGKGMTVIFSFQRTDRNYTGLAVIRRPDGKFVRNSDGTIFNIPQLARAITNLPAYITNGNTPQGIFSMQGIDTSSNKFIGRTPNIQMVMPLESDAASFLHNKNIKDSLLSIEQYKNLLPDSWKNYFPAYESYYAGKAGRTEIISHGTTVDPSYYKGKSYYPNTPTLGCLSAKEIWSSDGSRWESDQAALVGALLSTGNTYGYVVVINLDNSPRPVVIDDVIINLLEAENHAVGLKSLN